MDPIHAKHSANLVGEDDSFGPFHFGRFRKGMDHALAEKTVHALEYVAQIARVGGEFVFVGGTAAQLITDEGVLRLSKDVDLLVPNSTLENWRLIVAEIANRFGGEIFAAEEQVRNHGGLHIPALHYRIEYPSSSSGLPVDDIELHAVFTPIGFATQRTRLARYFYKTKGDVSVLTPTRGAMVGLKLTTLGPSTIGIPRGKPNFDVAVGKQLFDLGNLIQSDVQFGEIAAAYRASFEQQAKYHDSPPKLEEVLIDTFYAVKVLAAPPDVRIGSGDFRRDVALVKPLVDKLRGYVGSETFDRVAVRLAASRLALLVALLSCVLTGEMSAEEAAEDWRRRRLNAERLGHDSSAIQAARDRLAEIDGDARPHLHLKDFVYSVGGEALLLWDAAYQAGPARITRR